MYYYVICVQCRNGGVCDTQRPTQHCRVCRLLLAATRDPLRFAYSPNSHVLDTIFFPESSP